MWFKKYKKSISVIAILVSFTFLIAYTIFNPSLIDRILKTDPRTLGLLSLLYTIILGTQLILIYMSVRLCSKKLTIKKSLFLSIYSALANFFGPLQSGPGVRAVYLKKTIGLAIREYTYATLFYYAAYALINGSLLFITTWPLITVLGLILSLILIILGASIFHFGTRLKYVLAIYTVAVAQVITTTTIYYLELHATSPGTHYSYAQAIVFSASAALSMFVSLTPGGIGIREAFIVFTQSLHHISLASIIAAGVLDRAFYVLFLIILFSISSAMHIKTIALGKQTGNRRD